MSKPDTYSEMPSEGDQEDWDLEILQALISPSTAEDAALACAAAWMNFTHAQRVAVAVFDSSTSCIVAHGQRDNDTHIAIYVGRGKADVSILLRPELLNVPGGPCSIETPTEVICWAEHFSAVLVARDESAVSDERVELIKDLSRKLLSRWTTPVTSFANPDHMAAMAEFAAGAGHEINNPLGSIIGQAQMVLKRTDQPELRQALETIGSQAWRIRDMIGDTMLFARPPQPEFEICNLVALADSVVETVNKSLGKKVPPVRLKATSANIPVFADHAQIRTLMTNLVRNACQAVMDNDTVGNVTVDVHQVSDFAARFAVTDNGAEIPEQIRKHLFDPFFSGRQAGRGLGFGLCHCWQIARMHNGILMQESLPDGGNRFLAVLPAECSEA